jgi:hypothetical protein
MDRDCTEKDGMGPRLAKAQAHTVRRTSHLKAGGTGEVYAHTIYRR